MTTAQREKVRFLSGGIECAAWHYPGSNGACVVMAGGGGVTKEPGTDRFAGRFHAEGFTVLAFDYRHLGESGGQPRQVVRTGTQLADWAAALAFAATRPDVSPDPGCDLGLLTVRRARVPRRRARRRRGSDRADPGCRRAGRNPERAAPRDDRGGPALPDPGHARRAARPVRPRPPADTACCPRGTVAMLTTPDAQDGDRALNPGNRNPEWQQTIAARSVLRLSWYRPGRAAGKIRFPLLVLTCDEHQSALAAPAARAAERAPLAEHVHVTGGHYAPFLDEHQASVLAELDFLRRHLCAQQPTYATTAGSRWSSQRSD